MRSVQILGVAVFIIVFINGAFLWAESADEILKKAATYLKKGDYEKAISKYEEAIALDPKSAPAYNLLGMAYRFRHAVTRNYQYKKEEISAFKKAIELDPAYWVSMVNLGAAYYYLGEKKEAAECFKKALEIYPEHPEKSQLENMIREGSEVSSGEKRQ